MRNGVPVGTAADADGRWSFGFNPGESVRVSSIGYTTRWTTAGSLALAFALTPLVEELPGVTITAPRPRRNAWAWILIGAAIADSYGR